MKFQQLNRSDADLVFVICKNISGATMTAFNPAFFDTADTTDGNDGYAISNARTGQSFMFAGIPQSDILDDDPGLVQVYGKGSANVIVTTSMIAGDQLDVATSTANFVNWIPQSSTSLVPDIGTSWNFVSSMSAMASGVSGAVQEPVFIRAL